MKKIHSKIFPFFITSLFLLLIGVLFFMTGCKKEDEPEKLSVTFTVTPESGTTETIFRFTPYARPAELEIGSYLWDFESDGIIDYDGADWDDEIYIDHRYSKEGVYTATLDIHSAEGDDASYSKTVSVAGSDNCHLDYHTPCPDAPTVMLDGRAYKTVQIGNQCWMAENLNWGEILLSNGTAASDNAKVEKICYNDDPANCEKYGGLYTWNEAMDYKNDPGTAGICPVGWHLPTKAEWDQLANALGGFEIAGSKLMSCENDAWTNGDRSTNISGFTAFPSGYNWIWFEYEGIRTWFWTSDAQNDEDGILKSMDREEDPLTEVYANKYYSACVRCIKD